MSAFSYCIFDAHKNSKRCDISNCEPNSKFQLFISGLLQIPQTSQFHNHQVMNLLTQCMDGLNSTNTATAEDFILRSGYATAADNSLYNGAQPSVYLPSIDHYSIAPNGGLVHKNGPFKCDKCPAVFMLEVFFQLHAKKHSESERALEAQAGNVKQRNKKSGKKRFKQRNKTAGDSVQGLFCRRCRITAPTFEELLRHMAQHSSSKEPSQCGNCDYVTMNRGNFKRHIMTHGNIRPFKCHMCPFSASQKTHLNKHMRYHCGNREFQCDLCSYNCSDKANFNRHKNLHPINGCNSGNANVTPNTMVRQSGGIGGGGSSSVGGIAGGSGSQQNNCGQCTNTMAQLSTKQDPTCTTTQTATTLTDHMNQVVAMTTADVAMAADIAMTTRDVMSRQLDITRLFKNVGQDLSHDPHPSSSGVVDPMVSMISNPRNIN